MNSVSAIKKAKYIAVKIKGVTKNKNSDTISHLANEVNLMQGADKSLLNFNTKNIKLYIRAQW